MKRLALTLLCSLTVLAVLCAAPAPVEAACGAGLFRPFGGRGVPVLRRLRGRGIGQANYAGPYGSYGAATAGGCANGACQVP